MRISNCILTLIVGLIATHQAAAQTKGPFISPYTDFNYMRQVDKLQQYVNQQGGLAQFQYMLESSVGQPLAPYGGNAPMGATPGFSVDYGSLPMPNHRRFDPAAQSSIFLSGRAYR